MPNNEEPPEISDGARVLLRIARTHDKHSAMAKNLALLCALDFSEKLLKVCYAQSGTSLASFLESSSSLKSFLQITATSINLIRKRIDYFYGLSQRELLQNH